MNSSPHDSTPNLSSSGENEATQPEMINVSGLLRLKRYEKPPEGYFDDFLLEFQRRQRIEAARPRLSEWLAERIWNLLPDLRIPSYAYATVGLFAVAFSAWVLTSEEFALTGRMGTPANSPGVSANLTGVSASLAGTDDEAVRLHINAPPGEILRQPVTIPGQMRVVGSLPPHYALDPRPRAESEPFSF